MRAARLALALGLFVAAAAAGWALRSSRLPQDETPDLRRDLDAARAERERAADELTDARRRARAAARDASGGHAEAPRASVPADAAPAPGEEAPTWQERVGAYPLYPFDDAAPEVRDALAGVDWLAATRCMSGMIPVAEQIATSLERGESPSAEAIGKSQEHNGPLVTIAMRLNANGVSGSGPNGSFTHPAFLTNAIAATLEAVGQPTDVAQRERLAAVGSEFVRRERERVAAYGVDDAALSRLIDETRLKHDYLVAVFGLLTETQTAALRPAMTRGRIAADLFSEGLIWVGRAHPLWHRDDAHLAELVETQLLTESDAPPSERVHEIVVAWVAGLPRNVVEHTPDPLERMGMIDAGHATECASHMLRLVETLLREGALLDSETERLRTLEAVPVPFRTSSE